MSKIYKLLIFFIIVLKNNKSNNKVTLRTLEVNSRGQKQNSEHLAILKLVMQTKKFTITKFNWTCKKQQHRNKIGNCCY